MKTQRGFHNDMTPGQFKQWRAHMGVNRTVAARMLKVGKNTPKLWEDGTVTIPEEIDLMCSALALQVRPWSEYQKGEKN